ncbi:UDP-2,4-diacetamido-2,4,6-trideoxy-beta-L-altropyranose hydrolase [Phycobacter azelaicus]|uniref:UDP-2,4-diacetamido-2,4, 6-trideoxy-beta-L-altropyranose hydrolase n=1 Tax=Phycobacter azelaicus TaxID=2668075 RepID=UPI001865E6A0|nr:UDP-2,4-diacetamido-2,4,6-trideoxy-beta-L-altropyranose hydrolase [Phycobacter azelaicus]MBE1294806.1 UDP-2,4-diacetamido-2,4,6-trideoxy-beta-L-altropyranose hydrolase [Paracoccaceae bacterium]
MTRTVVFRCNANARVGLGHLMRCREMARVLKLRGWHSVILGPPTSLQTAQDMDLFIEWQEIPERGSDDQDCAIVLESCARHEASLAVMDDYRITPTYQQRLMKAGIRWLQQFDASLPFDYWCDLLVNASPYEKRSQYMRWLQRPEAQETLFGPAYAVLRPAFLTITPQPDTRDVRRILVAFGGGDDRGAIALSLNALAGHLGNGITLVVVCGPANPNLADITARVSSLPGIELHVAPADMASLMADCDLALIAGGTMSYEAAICGVPMIFIGLAPNQERPCRGWTDRIGAPYLGDISVVSGTMVRNAVMKLIENADQRAAMSRAGRALVDGLGAERLVDALLNLQSRQKDKVSQ